MVEIHPEDARERGVTDGALVRLVNDLGEVVLRAKVTDAVRRGVLYTPKGTWLRTSQTGQTVNSLISADLKADIVGGACYNETFVEIQSVDPVHVA